MPPKTPSPRIVLLTLCFLVLFSPKPSTASGQGSLDAESLSVAGLANGPAVGAIFRGEFHKVEFNREDMLFSTLFQQYLEAYARTCSQHLPAKKIEMTRQRCVQERVTRNGYGVEIERTCVSYVDEGTGLYAKPEMLAAKQEIDRLMAADSLRNAWRLLTMSQQNPLAGTMQLARDAQGAANDMKALVRKNACSGPGLLRFEENLRRFAWNKSAVRLNSQAGANNNRDSSPEALARSLDYPKLIAALVADQSRSWVLNRFVRGSVREVAVASRNHQGLPARITATYSFDGFSGRSRGAVTVDLTDALPTCIYFSDAPNVCRTPNRRIVASHTEEAQAGPPGSTGTQTAKTPVSSNPSIRPKALTSTPTQRTTPAQSTTTGRRTPSVRHPTSSPPSAAATNSARRRRAVPPEYSSTSTTRPAPREAAPQRSVTPQPPQPKRELRAVSYIQGIKDACLEVMTGGERREPEASYCFCLSAASGSAPLSSADAKWFFENFSDKARQEIEHRYPPLVRMFRSCRAQFEARSNPG